MDICGRPSEKGGRKHGYRIYDRHTMVFEDCEYEDQNWQARLYRLHPNEESAERNIAIGHIFTLHAHLANIVVRTGNP